MVSYNTSAIFQLEYVDLLPFMSKFVIPTDKREEVEDISHKTDKLFASSNIELEEPDPEETRQKI